LLLLLLLVLYEGIHNAAATAASTTRFGNFRGKKKPLSRVVFPAAAKVARKELKASLFFS